MSKSLRSIATVVFCGLPVAWSTAVLADTDEEIPEMHVMPDGTLSWEQPDSSGIMGYNGYCGETAAANIVSMLRYPTSPDVVKEYCHDATPGSLPSTIARYLWDELDIRWATFHLQPNQAFSELKQALKNGTLVAENGNSPVALLLKVKGQKAYHWITVVDIDANNFVIYNEYGKQKSMTPKELDMLWGFSGITAIWGTTLRKLGITPYTMVSQLHKNSTYNVASR